MLLNGPPTLPAALFSLVLSSLVLSCGWYFDRLAEPRPQPQAQAAKAQPWMESVKTALLQVGVGNDNAHRPGR